MQLKPLHVLTIIAVFILVFAAVWSVHDLTTPVETDDDDNAPEDSVDGDAQVVDIHLPSTSTGVPGGKLAVRVHLPAPEDVRYDSGAPVVVVGEGGTEVDGLVNKELANLDDVIVITFIYPGGENLREKRHSDGEYDYRGVKSIEAMRDVILYAAGEKADSEGKSLGDRASYDVLHDNVGFIGFSFGGNIGIATAALEGEAIAEHLKYVIQWETPVSSQVATRDLGVMLLEPLTAGGSERGVYFNPRYRGYGPMVLDVDLGDIAYDPDGIYPVFLDGNGDGVYTTTTVPEYEHPTPDLDGDGELELDEDYGLDTYWYDTYDEDGKLVYSRPATHALDRNDAFDGGWPAGIATVEEADAYWNIRESVRSYELALENLPELEGMYILSEEDHVQTDPHKSHVHQAYDGWTEHASWFKINPDPEYMVEVDPSLEGVPLPSLPANTAPGSWEDTRAYCIPESVADETYQIAAVHQMADRVEGAR